MNATATPPPVDRPLITPELLPDDEHNRRLGENVHPADWTNPVPDGRYNLVVVGGGTAGLVAAAGSAGLGAKVALVERRLLGGDCLNVGCVPSKAIIAAARAAAAVRDAGDFGVRVDGFHVDFPAVMERLRRLRADISPHDSASRFRDLGVDVYVGDGRFIPGDRVEVTGDDGTVTTLNYAKAVIATGARAVKLPIDGIDEIDPLTNESLFSLTELPERLTVIGGGPIGSEMAQAFARFGSRVTQIEKYDHILAREDPDAARVVQASMKRDGVEFVMNAEVVRFERRGDEKITVVRIGDGERRIVGDEVLIGIGRTPNVEGLGLDDVGVSYDARAGVSVDSRMRTANPNIYAAGDIASRFKFTHAADFQSRLIIGNALFFSRGRSDSLVIPWSTYTSPELAHVGMTVAQAAQAGVEIDTYTQPFSGVDRAILEGDTEGFARVHVRKGTDKIVGATIVGENAGDLIAPITQAMTHGQGLKEIGSTIHPYPTTSDAVRKLGDQYNKTRLTPRVASLMERLLRWRR